MLLRAQRKLIQVVQGAVLDVVVDLRRRSPTFGRYVSVLLSADNGRQILVPVGFGHGLLVLQPHTHVTYKVSAYYSKEHDDGLLWNDPDIGIDWGSKAAEPIVSEKDRSLPTLSEIYESLPF